MNTCVYDVKVCFISATVSGTLILLLILDIAMLVVGIVKKNECPIEDRIPLYLIVAGNVSLYFIYSQIYDISNNSSL